MLLDANIIKLAKLLNSAKRITVLTGAGVSAASGIPTFREASGLWNRYRPEQLATPQAFIRNPELVWSWYASRREKVSNSYPNNAHKVLAKWSQRVKGFSLITQNVDGLHERAKTTNVIRFHGSLWELKCWTACSASPKSWKDETVPFKKIPPCCPYCGGLARPGVVWFGESIDPNVLKKSLEASRCDVFLTVGTSSVVNPAAALVSEAKAKGAYVAEINIQKTPASEIVDLVIKGTAEEILTNLEKTIFSQ